MINSEILKKAFICGAENIARRTDQVNAINVFPVPDGDTGTNLAMTMTGCAEKLKNLPEMGAGELADIIAGNLFRSARGNSGVIFSLIFSGFAKSVAELDVIDAQSLAKGIEAGCNEAYAAVEKPAEGTMLTVIRLAGAKASAAASRGKNTRETFAEALSAAKTSLRTTPNLLPVLKKHGCVDAGGQGLVYIMEGMLEQDSPQEEIQFIYCTEFLINKAKNADISAFRKHISGFGNCTAAAEHSGIIKVHIHTNQPDKVLESALRIGELTDIKIDNMRIQAENGVNQWN